MRESQQGAGSSTIQSRVYCDMSAAATINLLIDFKDTVTHGGMPSIAASSERTSQCFTQI